MEEETLRSNLKGTSEKPPLAVDEKAALISNVPPQVGHFFGI
jgi:hypothetical protein